MACGDHSLSGLFISMLNNTHCANGLFRTCKYLFGRDTVKSLTLAIYNKQTRVGDLKINSYIVPECSSRITVVVSLIQRKLYYVVPIRYASSSILYCKRNNIIRGSQILVTPRYWYPIPNFANYRYLMDETLAKLL